MDSDFYEVKAITVQRFIVVERGTGIRRSTWYQKRDKAEGMATILEARRHEQFADEATDPEGQGNSTAASCADT